jgi:ribosome-binding factor A
MSSRISDIKRSQKESLYHRIISSLFLSVTRDCPELAGLFINRIELSANKSNCFIYFGAENEDVFKEKLETLKLYKPSIRKALGDEIQTRYVPQLTFRFDKKLKKQREIEDLMNKLKDEGEL